MKVSSRIYKGIEFIQLSDLPQDQQDKIIEEFPEDFFIKILIDRSILSHCIQYKDYEAWFERQVVAHVPQPPSRIERTLEISPAKLVLGKA